MKDVMTISMRDHHTWQQYGLGDIDCLDYCIYKNERPSGHGDDEGEWYDFPEETIMVNGELYRVIFRGTHGKGRPVGSSHSTWAELYRVGSADGRYLKRMSEIEAMPDAIESDEPEDEPYTGPSFWEHDLTICDEFGDRFDGGIAYMGSTERCLAFLESIRCAIDEPTSGQDWQDIRHDGNRVGQIDPRPGHPDQSILSMERSFTDRVGYPDGWNEV